MQKVEVAGHTVWKDALLLREGKREVQVRFIGRCGKDDQGEILGRIAPPAPPLAWAKQIHSAVHLPARQGFCGEGDALVADRTDQPGVALSVITADCVPVLLAGPTHLAAIHAGWRGIAARIVEKTVTALTDPPGSLTAWIGPSIGACCYEVDNDVADQVTAVSTPEIATLGPDGKPHLDLVAAVARQLAQTGIEQVRIVDRCTRCNPQELASYRREGRGAGRNLAVVWW